MEERRNSDSLNLYEFRSVSYLRQHQAASKNKDKVFQDRMNISKEIRAKEKHKEGEKEKGGEKERPKEGGRCTKKESEGGGRK